MQQQSPPRTRPQHWVRKPNALPSPSRSNGRIRVRQLISSEAQFRSGADQQALESSSQVHELLAWRERVAQWFYDVVDHLDVSRETVFVSMNFLDRFIAVDASTSHISKEEYELMSTTCLFLAIRATGKPLPISRLLQLCQSSLQSKDIQNCGRRILRKLSLKQRLIAPTSFAAAFLQLIESSLPQESFLSLHETVSYLAELSACDHIFMKIPSSQIAFAAVYIGLESDKATCDLEPKVRDSFLNLLQMETGVSCASIGFRALYNRLRSSYQQSLDCAEAEASAPHIIIEDEPEHTPITGSSTESLPSLLPCRPVLTEMHKSSKTARLV